jgi:hypothetical protein
MRTSPFIKKNNIIHHKKQYNEISTEEQQQSQSTIVINSNDDQVLHSLTTTRPLSNEKIYLMVANMVIKDTQPYTIVEDEGFRNLINKCRPFYPKKID